MDTAQASSRGRLLVVEDSESSRAMVCGHLREENFDFEEAENGAIAVERARATRYDLILMDINMPMMDGYEAIRRIRQWEESHGLVRTPIIAFTGSSFEKTSNARWTAALTCTSASRCTKMRWHRRSKASSAATLRERTPKERARGNIRDERVHLFS